MSFYKGLFFSVFFIIGFIFGLFEFLSWAMPKPTNNDIAYVIKKDYGTVKSIKKCSSGRHSYECEIRTTKFRFPQLDVTRYPTEMIVKGDNLFRQVKVYEDLGVYKTYNCKNNSCTPISSCYSWMGCWDDKPTR